MHRGYGALLFASLLLTACDNKSGFEYYTLALSWQPAFCEQNAERAECQALDDADYAAGHLSLHGLWPSSASGQHPSYCGVDKAVVAQDQPANWCQLPEPPRVTNKTKTALAPVMPGVESCLDRHEWIKHGTCTGAEAELYFAGSTHLVDVFDKSQMGQVIASNVGRYVSRTQLIAAFQKEYLSDAANALTLLCEDQKGISVLTEIRITLIPGNLGGAITNKNLYVKATPKGTCPDEFRIDPAG